MALTTLARLKSHLQLVSTDTTKDVLFAETIERISAQIRDTAHRNFDQATLTEYHDGDGSQINLVLREFPVASVTTLHDDPDRAYGASTLIAAADYVVDLTAGIITLDGLVFAKGLQNIKVVYVGGYKVIPQDLELACLKLCAAEFIEQHGQLNILTEIPQANRLRDMRREADDTIARYTKTLVR